MTFKFCYAAAALCMIQLVGCGSGQFPVAPVSGKVLCGGQPVSSGTITFTPVGGESKLETGKPASAAIAADGTFKLSTFGRFDGAIVGKHNVQYTGSEGDESEAPETGDSGTRTKPAAKAATCVQTATIQLDVQRGSNDFTIELKGK